MLGVYVPGSESFQEWRRRAMRAAPRNAGGATDPLAQTVSRAVKNGDAAKLRKLLDAGAPLDMPDEVRKRRTSPFKSWILGGWVGGRGARSAVAVREHRNAHVVAWHPLGCSTPAPREGTRGCVNPKGGSCTWRVAPRKGCLLAWPQHTVR